MRHEAKVDWWIGLATLVGLVVPLVSAITTSTPWGYAASIFVAFLIFGFCYPQWYETTPDALVIRAGLTTCRIPYSAMTAAGPSSSTRSSFALSLDRVEVRYGAKSVLIAPKDQAAFFDDLKARAPQLCGPGHANLFAGLE